MPIIQFVIENIMTIILLLILLMLVAIVAILLKKRTERAHLELAIDLGSQIEQLEKAARHHADVSAVVKMVEQIDQLDEDVIALLEQYPESVRAAAWLHYINILGSALQHSQSMLESIYKDYSGPNGHMYAATVRNRQSIVNELRSELDKAIKASGRTGMRVV